MIRTFADKETEKIYHQGYSKKFPREIQDVALRKLIMIDNAKRIEDLMVPPSNRLEKLLKERRNQYSIRINNKYRVCFSTDGKDYYDVEIVNYH